LTWGFARTSRETDSIQRPRFAGLIRTGSARDSKGRTIVVCWLHRMRFGATLYGFNKSCFVTGGVQGDDPSYLVHADSHRAARKEEKGKCQIRLK
jgi:hypothetical protein